MRPRACGLLADMYERGRGVASNGAKLAQLLEKLCAAGDSTSCRKVGSMYGTGREVTKDDAKAAELFRKACDGAALDSSCTHLGFMYEHGLGVPKDRAQAIQLYQKDCDRGRMAECTRLGNMYTSDQEAAKALPFYVRGCELGTPVPAHALERRTRGGRVSPRTRPKLWRSTCRGAPCPASDSYSDPLSRPIAASSTTRGIAATGSTVCWRSTRPWVRRSCRRRAMLGTPGAASAWRPCTREVGE
jgi:TPR repeat protein